MTNWTNLGIARHLRAGLLLAGALSTAGHASGQGMQQDRGGNRGEQRGSAEGCDLTITALTADQRLVKLRVCDPTYPRSVRGISGLTTDTRLVGIDYRVQDGKLYGVGNEGGIYVLDANTGLASKARQLSVRLQGESFGVDFNPAADALRIASNTGQNLRHPFADPAAATVADGALNYTAGTAAGGVTGAAYINNDLSADTGTFLFDIDTALNQLSLQVPPNAGSLVRIGALGVDPDSSVGFDIYSKLKDEATTENTGYATLVVAGVTRLYEIDLLTGKADRIDIIQESILDISLSLTQKR